MQTAARNIGQAIQIERKGRGMSQAALARALETTEKNIRLWESGKSAPSHGMYERLALLFGWVLPYDSETGLTGRYLQAVSS